MRVCVCGGDYEKVGGKYWVHSPPVVGLMKAHRPVMVEGLNVMREMVGFRKATQAEARKLPDLFRGKL